MWSARLSRASFVMLNVAAYLTLLTVAIPTLASVPRGDRLWVGALLALFGVLVTLFHRLQDSALVAHGYLLAQATIVSILILRFPGIGLGQVHLLFFVLSAYAMLMLPVLPALVWIVAFFLFTMGAGVMAFGWGHAVGMAAIAGGHALFGGFGALLRQAESDRRQTELLLAELREAHAQLQRYAAQAQYLAVAEERTRLAREMHDALGHRLTVAVVQLEGAQRLIPSDPKRAASMVGAMREELKLALGELRRTVSALRSAPEADLPLPEALARLARSFGEATGLTVEVDVAQDIPPLPEAYRLTLYRTAQEGLTNVQRHAQASRARLSLRAGDQGLTMTVADNGRGFPVALLQDGAGLRGLRERAAALQGDVQLANDADGGARLTLRLPWAGEA